MSRRMPLDAASDAEDNGGLVRPCVPASFDPSLARVAPHRARGRSSTCRRRDRDAAVTSPECQSPRLRGRRARARTPKRTNRPLHAFGDSRVRADPRPPTRPPRDRNRLAPPRAFRSVDREPVVDARAEPIGIFFFSTRFLCHFFFVIRRRDSRTCCSCSSARRWCSSCKSGSRC